MKFSVLKWAKLNTYFQLKKYPVSLHNAKNQVQINLHTTKTFAVYLYTSSFTFDLAITKGSPISDIFLHHHDNFAFHIFSVHVKEIQTGFKIFSPPMWDKCEVYPKLG